jgi:hypothetical protein
MIITKQGKDFQPHPDYQGPAVIVDVTEPKKVQTKFGEQDQFRVVFETAELNEEGKHWCAWSNGFAPSLNEKANFRKFLKALFGRDLTKEELEGFDTESLIGMNCFVVISQVEKDDKVYANIASCTPLKNLADAVKPSGEYKRTKDRPKQDSNYHKTEAPKPAGGQQSAAAAAPVDHSKTKIHIGKHSGHELREVDPASLDKLAELWMPGAKDNAKATADDKRLVAALEWYVAQKSKAKVEEDDSTIPY